MKSIKFVTTLALMMVCQTVFGQKEKVIDASKPTNFYNSVNHALEFISRPIGGNLMGYRANLVLAPSDRNLILGEIPILYNSESKKIGLGDVRARYFYLPHKDYTKFFGAFGPSIDIIAPTGSLANGLGTGRWTIAPGIALGFMFSQKVQVFPILSYQFTSKQVTGVLPSIDYPINGGSIQFVTVLVPNSKNFFQVTPQFAQSYQNGQSAFAYIQEFNYGYQVSAKSIIGIYFKRDFKTELAQVSVGMTKYF